MLHRIVELFRTRRGLLFVAVGVILLSIGFAPSCRATKRPASPITGHVPNLSTGSSNLHFVVPRPTIPLVANPFKTDRTIPTNSPTPVYREHVDFRHAANGAAPFGRQLQCQLVNTLESLAPQTPIIGLVTESLFHQGRLVIPAGAEIHGQAQLDRVRERVISTGPWTIVLQTGEQLVVPGVALDREFAADGSD